MKRGQGAMASVLAWFAGAAAAVAVGMLALSTIEGGPLPDALRPLPPDSGVQAEPDRSGAAASATDSATRPASPTPGASRTPGAPNPPPASGPGPGQPGPGSSGPGSSPDSSDPESSRRVISTPAGSVVAECRPGGAYLVSWSPAPGYTTESVRRGPAQVAQVMLRSADDNEVINVRCVDGVPQRVGGGNDKVAGDGDAETDSASDTAS